MIAAAIESSAALLGQQIRKGFSETTFEISDINFPDASDELRWLAEATEAVVRAIEIS